MSNNKSRSNKPYDASNSFVKKVASRVSGLIPKSTSWLSGWFAPPSTTDDTTNLQREPAKDGEENFHDAMENPPPPKRFKLTSDQQYVDTYLPPLPSHLVNQGESSSRRVPNSSYIDASAIAGPSGLGSHSSGFVASTPAVSSVESQEPKTNGEDCSESGESTSGCSSLEPQINRGLPSVQTQSRHNESFSSRKHLLEDKHYYSYMQNSRSLSLDHSTNSRKTLTVGRRNNPSFCVNTFGSPLFGERGSVNDMILNSPFYTGRTTYGGASSASYRRSVGSASISSSPANSEKLAKHTIKVKAGNNQSYEDSSMSQTAKRILATLEQFSTPILDAKRIPVSQQPALSIIGSKKRLRTEDIGNDQASPEQSSVPIRTSKKPLHWAKGAPSTSQLTIPSAPDTLIFRRRELEHDSLPSSSPPTSSSSSVAAYSLRTDENNSASRNTLKMKPRLNEKEQKEPVMAAEVNLPKVPLPISSLPTFDITVPAPTSTLSKQPSSQSPKASSIGSNTSKVLPFASKTAISSPSVTSDTTSNFKSQGSLSDVSFSFSSPTRVSSIAKEQSLSPFNNFTFSNPLPASAKFSEPLSNCVSARPKASLESKKQSDEFPCGLKPASDLKTGSVMDILGKKCQDTSKNLPLGANGNVSLMEKFRPAAGTWECDKCLIRNKSDLSKCAACGNPQEKKSLPNMSNSLEVKSTQAAPVSVNSGFGTQFKMAQGMWECSACLVRNKDSDDKCLSCTTPKSGAPAASKQPATTVSSFSGWGDKFKPASNTWECTVCMVRNGAERTACQSCTTKKPGSTEACIPQVKSSWGDKFKQPEGSWVCGDCMITNKSADLQCVACSSKKPGSETKTSDAKPMSSFSFGVPPSDGKGSTNPAFSFGIPKDTKDLKVAEIPNVSSSTGFKFGESKTEVPATGFSFGVPSSSSSATSTSSTTTVTVSTSQGSGASVLTSPSAIFSSKMTSVESKSLSVPAQQPSAPTETPKPTFSFGGPSSSGGKPATATLFSLTKTSEGGAVSQPASSTISPLGGKRKFGDETPTSSAVPMKFGAGGNPLDVATQAKAVTTSSSLVSSTSGPVFSFSASSNSNFSSASTLLVSPVTSTANDQSAVNVARTGTTNSIFSNFNSPPSSTAAKPAFSLGGGSTKDESVSSTWKQPSNTTITTSNVVSLSNSDANGAASTKPSLAFGGTVSSSGMAFGGSATALTPTFTFGAGSDKTAVTSKPQISFGSPASSAPIFGSATGNLANNATPSFGSSSGTSFGSSISGSNSLQAFQTTSTVTVAPTFSTQAASAFTPLFGATSEEKKPSFAFNAPSEAKVSGFSFSAPSEEKKAPFSFGATSEDTKKAAFSFNPTTTSPGSFQSSSPSMFTFGASTANGPANSNFAFGNPTPSFTAFNSQPSASPAGISFGSAAPAFGSASTLQASNPSNTFPSPNNFSSFGATNSQPAVGFNFSAQGATSFGSQNQPSAAPAPFNFSESLKPQFNFTSGGPPVTFNASQQDASGSAQPRRFKKATRRTPR